MLHYLMAPPVIANRHLLSTNYLFKLLRPYQPESEMKVRILVGAEATYAMIQTPSYNLDVKLSPGRAPAQSLRESADEALAKADYYDRLAFRMRTAAITLENQA